MAYTHLTLAAAKTALSQRLHDTGKVYWTDEELGYYIIEALQTWGLATGYWRDTGILATVAGTAFYNISSIQNTGSESLLSYAVTDTTLAKMIQHHLLEPAAGTSWTGSEQFIYADITGALQRRRDNILVDTACRITVSTQIMPATAKTVDLSGNILSIKRLSWKGAITGEDWPLFPEDISNQRNYSTDYLLTQGVPQTFSSSSTRPLRLIIAPPSNEPGTLTIMGVEAGADLTGAGISMGIPDDMCWIAKWGAMADMLGKEGPGQDLARSYFCERRYRLGIELSRLNPTVLNAEINGVALTPESISRLDQYDPNWYSTQGVPELLGNVRNYIALATAPNGIYSVLLDVVRKAVVPSSPTDDAHQIQIGKDYVSPILDYAEHLAAFKCGGEEFRHTFRGASNFFNAALQYNQRLASQSPNLRELIEQSTLDDSVMPLRKKTYDPEIEHLVNAADQSDQTRNAYREI